MLYQLSYASEMLEPHTAAMHTNARFWHPDKEKMLAHRELSTQPENRARGAVALQTLKQMLSFSFAHDFT